MGPNKHPLVPQMHTFFQDDCMQQGVVTKVGSSLEGIQPGDSTDLFCKVCSQLYIYILAGAAFEHTSYIVINGHSCH